MRHRLHWPHRKQNNYWDSGHNLIKDETILIRGLTLQAVATAKIKTSFIQKFHTAKQYAYLADPECNRC